MTARNVAEVDTEEVEVEVEVISGETEDSSLVVGDHLHLGGEEMVRLADSGIGKHLCVEKSIPMCQEAGQDEVVIDP